MQRARRDEEFYSGIRILLQALDQNFISVRCYSVGFYCSVCQNTAPPGGRSNDRGMGAIVAIEGR